MLSNSRKEEPSSEKNNEEEKANSQQFNKITCTTEIAFLDNNF